MKKKMCAICVFGIAIGFSAGVLVNQSLWNNRLDGIVDIIKHDMTEIIEEGDNVSSYNFKVKNSKFLMSPIEEFTRKIFKS